MKSKTLIYLLLIFVFILSLSHVFAAEDQVVVNSDNWQDIYLGMVYANIHDISSSFIVNHEHAMEILSSLDKSKTNILLIQSDKEVVVSDYKPLLENEGFTVNVLEGSTSEINAKLIEKTDTNKFILVSDDFGYNAISVGGYASASNTMPIFANREYLDDVSSAVSTKDDIQMIAYSKINRQVKDEFSDYITETIDLGDKYSNNLAIFKKHALLSGNKQVIFTSGNFIEGGIVAGVNPVLFVGDNKVPDNIYDLVDKLDLKVAIVIGTQAITNAKKIKDKTDIKLYAKFAKGINGVKYPLDMIRIPSYDYDLNIKSVSYNIITKQLEVTYANTGRNYLMFKSDFDILVDGNSIGKGFDDEGILIHSNSELTITYNFDLTQYNGKDVTVSFNVLLGEDVKALDHLLTQDVKLSFVEINDDSNIEIEKVVYNKMTKRFEVTVRNLESSDVYTKVQIYDLIVDDYKENFESKKAKILANDKLVFKIKAELEPVDIEDNENVNIRAYYGSRENVLAKVLETTVAFSLKTMTTIYLLVGLLLLAILIFLFFFFVKDKDDDDKEKARKKKSKSRAKKKKSKF